MEKIKFNECVLSSGDKVDIQITDDEGTIGFSGTLTESFMKMLVDKGYATIVKDDDISEDIKKLVKEKNHIELIRLTLNALTNKSPWGVEKLCAILDDIDNINHTAVLSLFYKEIANILNQQYPEPISKAKNHYIIRADNGKVGSFVPQEDTDWDSIAVFKCNRDASFAIEAVNMIFTENNNIDFEIDSEGLFKKE